MRNSDVILHIRITTSNSDLFYHLLRMNSVNDVISNNQNYHSSNIINDQLFEQETDQC